MLATGAACLVIGGAAGYAFGHSQTTSRETSNGQPAAAGAPKHDRQSVGGSLELTDTTSSTYWSSGQSCSGSGGYSDIAPGAQVTLTDGAGTIVGTTNLEQGNSLNTYTCVFNFEFQGVELSDDFYSVEVSHRGKITKSRSELQSSSGRFQLSLGGG